MSLECEYPYPVLDTEWRIPSGEAKTSPVPVSWMDNSAAYWGTTPTREHRLPVSSPIQCWTKQPSDVRMYARHLQHQR